jgi:hypothetical protein
LRFQSPSFYLLQDDKSHESDEAANEEVQDSQEGSSTSGAEGHESQGREHGPRRIFTLAFRVFFMFYVSEKKEFAKINDMITDGTCLAEARRSDL